jgi:hypothetical protein
MRIKQVFILVIIFGLIFTINVLSQEKKKVEPVNWSELKPFLVDISGFEKKGESEENNPPSNKFSRVKQDYVAEGDEAIHLTLSISDFGFPSNAIELSKSMWAMEIDTPEKYYKQITIKDYPGVEGYRYSNKEARVVVLIEDRFLVRLEGFNFEGTSDFKNIIQKMDFKSFTNLK